MAHLVAILAYAAFGTCEYYEKNSEITDVWELTSMALTWPVHLIQELFLTLDRINGAIDNLPVILQALGS